MIQAPVRYDLLDGLRGVAAVIVVWYHFFEGFASSAVDMGCNHGYLAVDFFFVLSGFVIGVAYDKRCQSGAITGREFMIRRVIRLQPLVVLGVLFGLSAFLLQGSVKWDGSPVPLTAVLIALVLELFLIPVWPGATGEIRGNGELFPLNGPAWSLFFEYIASILYAVALARMSKTALRIIIGSSAVGLGWILFSNQSGGYNLGIGWSMEGYGLLGGFLRVAFSFTVGLLLYRSFKPRRINGAFWVCSLMLVGIMTCPYITANGEPSPMNALFDYLCVLFVFPTLVYFGACGRTTDRVSSVTCEFLGKLSYPVYILQYPVMYLFYAWVWTDNLSFEQVWPVCIALFFGIIFMALIALKFYDEPLRRLLSRKLLTHNKSK